MTTHAVTGVERRSPIPASSTAADGDALVPIRGGLLASAVVVAVNALALAVIGFTGSYRSVRDLALGWGGAGSPTSSPSASTSGSSG